LQKVGGKDPDLLKDKNVKLDAENALLKGKIGVGELGKGLKMVQPGGPPILQRPVALLQQGY